MTTQTHGVFGFDMADDVPSRLRVWSFVMLPGFFVGTVAASLLGAWFMHLLGVASGVLLTSDGFYGWSAAIIVTAVMAAAPCIGIRLALRSLALRPSQTTQAALIANACALVYVLFTTALTWYLGTH